MRGYKIFSLWALLLANNYIFAANTSNESAESSVINLPDSKMEFFLKSAGDIFDKALNKEIPVEAMAVMLSGCIQSYGASLAEENGENAQEIKKFPEKYLLVSIVKAGIGNRLRVIASGQIMADILKRKLIVHWPVNIHMPGKWQDLFQNPLTMLEDSPLAELGYDLKKIKNTALHDPVVCNLSVQNNKHARQNVLPYLEVFKQPIIYFESTIPFKVQHMPERSYEKSMNQYYLALKPTADIQEEIDGFKEKYNFNSYFMIGVHYRGWQMGKTDVNEKLTNDPTNKYIEQFVDVMIKEIQEVAKGQQSKPVAFFLAADNNAAKNSLLREPKLAGRIFTRDEDIERDSLQGQSSAMVDFFLLGSTNYIIGTTESSFSRGAARLTVQARKISVGADPYQDW